MQLEHFFCKNIGFVSQDIDLDDKNFLIWKPVASKPDKYVSLDQI